ncbi:MAG: hypothetical protein M1819_000701 [Sarea resinae]|nr:MAG: hypothetical protein M1819_000701 [Sarea resinae]
MSQLREKAGCVRCGEVIFGDRDVQQCAICLAETPPFWTELCDGPGISQETKDQASKDDVYKHFVDRFTGKMDHRFPLHNSDSASVNSGKAKSTTTNNADANADVKARAMSAPIAAAAAAAAVVEPAPTALQMRIADTLDKILVELKTLNETTKRDEEQGQLPSDRATDMNMSMTSETYARLADDEDVSDAVSDKAHDDNQVDEKALL